MDAEPPQTIEDPARSAIPDALSCDGEDLLRRAASISKQIALGAAERDLATAIPYQEYQAIAESGLLAARVPVEFGGPEVSFAELARVFVLLAEGDPNLTQAVLPHACLADKLRIYATRQQQEKFYAEMLQGRLITNANAERGGKLGDIATCVTEKDGEFRLDGQKYYCTGSAFADAFFILSATEGGGRAYAIVPRDRPGVTILDDWDGMGQRTTASGTVIFSGVVVGSDELIRLEQFGKRSTYEGAMAQLLHSAIDAGIALAALGDAVAYGRNGARAVPESGVARAGDDPYVLHAVGEMAMNAHASVALVERAGGALDAATHAFYHHASPGQSLAEASVAVAEAKMMAEHASLYVSEMIFRVGGASATSRARNLDRHWRNARTHTTHDPVAYKAKIVGDFYMNDRPPPISTKF
jgi:alkylation response protein AidB-like acyl-CoA dehydrogenase